ncbi:Endopolygalacturonase [Alteromonadaceae bacterium Bs31]|nr:Endopolygalacturonase [Alteromonadaceae bacterium Bs31]
MINTVLQAPFAAFQLKEPDFSEALEFSITEFGALREDKAATTRALKLAIEAASSSGLGRVIVPQGIWLTAAIHLKSNVNLHLEHGATLLFSDDPSDYLPPVKTSWEGMECYNYSPLVYAFECENVAITGEGCLQAKLEVWETWYERPKPHMEAIEKLYKMAASAVAMEQRNMTYPGANLRPHFIQFNRCRHVLVEGVSILNSPFWVLHPYLCEDVVIRQVKIEAHGHNNDGVDPEMTQNILIEDCVFDQGDDVISVKAGRDSEAWRLNKPCKNIVLRNCAIKNGHHLLTLGSELSGGIENVFIEGCHFESSKKFNHEYVEGTADADGFGNLLYIKTNAYRGGYVRNIYVHNCSAKSLGGGVLAIETDVLYQWRALMSGYPKRYTHIENIEVKNIVAEQSEFICKVEGDERAPVESVLLEDIQIDCVTDFQYQNDNIHGFIVK